MTKRLGEKGFLKTKRKENEKKKIYFQFVF